MGNEWFYTQNGQAAPAPVSSEQLKQLAGGGLLRPDDLVWKEGMPNWMPASSLSLAPNPSRTAESWLPLVMSTGMRAAAKSRRARSSNATASVHGTARS